MATQLQMRRGTTAQVAAFTGANGEVVVDTEKKTLFVNDGSTAGGLEIARADFSNISGSATLTLATLNATTVNTTSIDLTNLEVTNIKAKDGTAAGSIADSTGVVTIASAVLTTADINGGTFDGIVGGTTPAAGTFTALSVSGNLLIDGATPTLTIGDAGAEDTKIVFDGNAQDFYIGLDDSADDLVIGLGSTVGTTPIISVDENKDVAIPDGGLTITVSDNTDNLSLVSTDTDDNPGPNLRLYRNSANPAVNDLMGKIDFEGRNDNSQDVLYASISGKIMDKGDGTEDANLRFWTIANGTETETLTLSSGNVGIGVTAPDSKLHVKHAGGGFDEVARLTSVANSSGDGAFLGFHGNSTSKFYGFIGGYDIDTNEGGVKIGVGNGETAIADSMTKMTIDNTGVLRLKAGPTSYSTATSEDSFIYHDNSGNTSLKLGSNYQVAGSATHIMNGATTIASFWGGGGLSFNGDTADTQKLDDYERGAWTGVITTTGTDFSFSGSRASNAYYVKVGNQVTAWFDLSIPSPTGGTGSLIITGLPYAGTTTGMGVTSQMQLGRFGDVSSYNLYGYMGTNSDEIFIKYLEDDANPAAWPASQLNGLATPYCTGSITYYTTL